VIKDASPASPNVENDWSGLELLDVSHLLVLKKPEDEGPDVRGGPIHALIIHATKAHKNGNYLG